MSKIFVGLLLVFLDINFTFNTLACCPILSAISS